jgi:hypothetical protein
MAKYAYRKVSRQTGLWLALGLLGGTTPFLIGWGTHYLFGQLDWRGPTLVLLPLIGLVVVVMVRNALNQRARRKQVVARMELLGFRCLLKPDDAEKAAFFSPVQHLASAIGLRDTPRCIKWLARRDAPGGQILLFEAEYETGSGKSTQQHPRTILAVPAALAEIGGLPGLVVARRSRLERYSLRKSELRDARFADCAREWTLHGDAETAVRFLTPAIRAEMAHSPMGEMWCMGGGWACCICRGFLDAKNLVAFQERAMRVLTTAK